MRLKKRMVTAKQKCVGILGFATSVWNIEGEHEFGIIAPTMELLEQKFRILADAGEFNREHVYRVAYIKQSDLTTNEPKPKDRTAPGKTGEPK